MCEKYKIDEDPDVKAKIEEVQRAVDAKRDALRKRMDLTPEELKVVDEEVAKIRTLEFNPDTRNLIPIDSLMAAHAALSACSIRIRELHEKPFRDTRL